MSKNLVQKLIDSGMEFTEVSRAQAEAVVKHLVRAGELRRSEAGRTAQLLVDKGRETSVAVAGAVQSEVARQVGWLAARVDELEGQIEALVSSGAAVFPGAKKPAADVTARPAAKEPPAGKQAAASKTAGKRAKKSAGNKKSAAKKSGAKRRSPAKQAPAEKPSGSPES